MIFRTGAICLALGLATPAMAKDLALILGNERYDTLARVPLGATPVLATAGLQRLGFEVAAAQNARVDAEAEALAQFLSGFADADGFVVVLTGHFVNDGARTWFLPADAPEPTLLAMGNGAISIESLMQVMAAAPGRAVLVLGTDPTENAPVDPWLRMGLGPVQPPQGVTVVTGAVPAVSALVRIEMTQPGGDLMAQVAARDGLRVFGYQPRSLVLVAEAPAVPPTTPNALGEPAAWDAAKALDTADGYRAYLDRYPTGANAEAATAAIASILAEPDRDARLAEEALALSRDQRRVVQQNLTTLGYDTRGVDGILGAGSRRAITAWQQQTGFPQNGYLTREQISSLDAQAQVRAQEIAAEQERQRQDALRLDQAYWNETGARGDVAGYRAYLNRYPQGTYADFARSQLDAVDQANRAAQQAADDDAWRTARRGDSLASYRAYLSAFPRGEHATEARRKVAAFEAAAASAADTEAWNQAFGTGTIAAFRQYLRAFPQGAYRAEANTQIEALSAPTPTPTPAPEPEPEPTPAPDPGADAEARLGLDRATREMVEARLVSLGLDPGAVDGEFDAQTRIAIAAYQSARGLGVTGYIDQLTLLRLLADSVIISN